MSPISSRVTEFPNPGNPVHQDALDLERAILKHLQPDEGSGSARLAQQLLLLAKGCFLMAPLIGLGESRQAAMALAELALHRPADWPCDGVADNPSPSVSAEPGASSPKKPNALKKESPVPADQPCQLFEFLVRTALGTKVFASAIPSEEADRLVELFSQFNVLDDDHGFIEFHTIRGRIIHLNLKFVVGVARLDVVGRAGDQDTLPVCQDEDLAKLQGWQGLNDPSEAPAVTLFLDGLEEPLVCGELDRDVVELAATTLQEEPVTAIVSFSDEENLRTRFIPARNIILMDSLDYHEADPQ